MGYISREAYELMRERMLLKNRPPDAAIQGSPPEYESDLHEQIIEHCNAQVPKWVYFHSSMAHKTRSVLGTPDFTILADRSRTFHLEVKRKDGKLRPEQLAMQIRAEELGHKIHVVRSFEQYLAIVNKGLV